MLDFLAPLFGRVAVWLIDHDGECTKRWAKRTPAGLTCYRWPWRGGSLCLLLPGGKVGGGLSYVDGWALATAKGESNG